MWSLLLALLLKFTLTVRSPRPHEVTIQVIPPPNAVGLEVMMVNEDYYRDSALDVGDRPEYVLEWRGVPEGEYVVQCWAIDNQGKVIDGPVTRLFVR